MPNYTTIFSLINRFSKFFIQDCEINIVQSAMAFQAYILKLLFFKPTFSDIQISHVQHMNNGTSFMVYQNLTGRR